VAIVTDTTAKRTTPRSSTDPLQTVKPAGVTKRAG